VDHIAILRILEPSISAVFPKFKSELVVAFSAFDGVGFGLFRCRKAPAKLQVSVSNHHLKGDQKALDRLGSY